MSAVGPAAGPRVRVMLFMQRFEMLIAAHRLQPTTQLFWSETRREAIVRSPYGEPGATSTRTVNHAVRVTDLIVAASQEPVDVC